MLSSYKTQLSAGKYVVVVQRWVGTFSNGVAASEISSFVIGTYAEHSVAIRPVEWSSSYSFLLPEYLDKYGTCGGCNGVLGKYSLSALGKKWHYNTDLDDKYCWVCVECGDRLMSEVSILEA